MMPAGSPRRTHAGLSLAVALVAVLIGAGCKGKKEPETTCEKYADVLQRCFGAYTGSAEAEYLANAERACLELPAGDERDDLAMERDDIRCAERNRECPAFVECRGEEWGQTTRIRSALRYLESVQPSKPFPTAYCRSLLEIAEELKESDRPLARSVVARVVPLCGRDAWMDDARRELEILDLYIADMEASRAAGRPVQLPTGPCEDARHSVDKIAPRHRDEPAVKALIEQVTTRCSDDALAALLQRLGSKKR